ncbi:MAG: V-type ATPase subunit [Candidatus Improbicoccus pseudotrichonymphae]|uniref:V-type ATPase subunit n=1 Tax=Candidatus Improbicoccus pseudotrichonymphae TaxID=3033792 RepID=A0AA48KZA5_9FIRM|nr:MAG: V-type ATPase subunit [Candidatus Improbicoccus pseudotrichonymphae]
MLLGFSSAVLTKIRILFLGRLKDKDFKKMLNCNSFGEVVIYLKTSTVYSSVLSSLDETKFHCEYLESIFKKNLFDELAALGKYDAKVSHHVFSYIFLKMEVLGILKFLSFLKANQMENFEFYFPEFASGYIKINFKKMSEIKTYSDFLSVLKGSVYYKIMKKFDFKKTEDIDLNKIETSIYSFFFENYIRDLSINLNKEICNYNLSYLEILNLKRVFRLKKNYDADNNYILSLIYNIKGYNSKKIRNLILSEDFDNELKKFKFYSENLDIDRLSIWFKFNWAKKNIFGSDSLPVVFLSYIFLKEIEIDNIVNVIEGKRYGLKTEEIEKIITR